jgi:hypothetical protein
MTIVKANYTRSGKTAKAAVRYIENRPGKGRARLVRTLFSADGKVERQDAYTMIDQAAPGSYFYRLVISPDPLSEDSDRDIALRELTETVMHRLEARFQRSLQWVAAVHADHTDHRHIHALMILPARLQKQDFQRLRSAATEAALEQRRQRDLRREALERNQEQAESAGLSW